MAYANNIGYVKKWVILVKNWVGYIRYIAYIYYVMMRQCEYELIDKNGRVLLMTCYPHELDEILKVNNLKQKRGL